MKSPVPGCSTLMISAPCSPRRPAQNGAESRAQHHASHMIRYADSGELITADYDHERFTDQIVVLDIETGAELARADTASPLQSVVFPSPGFGRDLFVCSFSTLSRITVA